MPHPATTDALSQSLATYRDARWAQIDAQMTPRAVDALGVCDANNVQFLDLMIRHQYATERAAALEQAARAYQGHYLAALVAFATFGITSELSAQYIQAAHPRAPIDLPLAPHRLTDPAWITAAVHACGVQEG